MNPDRAELAAFGSSRDGIVQDAACIILYRSDLQTAWLAETGRSNLIDSIWVALESICAISSSSANVLRCYGYRGGESRSWSGIALGCTTRESLLAATCVQPHPAARLLSCLSKSLPVCLHASALLLVTAVSPWPGSSLDAFPLGSSREHFLLSQQHTCYVLRDTAKTAHISRSSSSFALFTRLFRFAKASKSRKIATGRQRWSQSTEAAARTA